jgi:hypothetical protein
MTTGPSRQAGFESLSALYSFEQSRMVGGSKAFVGRMTAKRTETPLVARKQIRSAREKPSDRRPQGLLLKIQI